MIKALYNVGSTIFTNPDLTVIDNKVGINQDTPDDDYDLDVNGIANATNYFIYDTISEQYEEFETVPSGVIIVWIETAIPEGWALCDGTGTYTDPSGTVRDIPDLRGMFIKSTGDSTSTGETGGTQVARMSEVTHDHEATTHDHTLGSGAHTHSISFSNKSVGGSLGNADAFKNHFQTGSSHSAALTSAGNHNHDTSHLTHGHNAQTTNSNSHNHPTASSETHSHDHVDESGNTATHYHDFHNEPGGATLVKFIIKVDEQL